MIEGSGPPDCCPGQDHVNPFLLPTRPSTGKAQIQIILFRLKTREFFVSSAFAHSPKPPSFVWIALPRRPSAGASPLRARARRSQAAAPHPHSQVPACPASVFAYRFSPGRAGDASRSALRASRVPPIFRTCCMSTPLSTFWILLSARQRVACLPIRLS